MPQDDEFEAFLRQFQPGSPKPLPTHRRKVLVLAMAAALLLAVIIPIRLGSRGPSRPPTPPATLTNSAKDPAKRGETSTILVAPSPSSPPRAGQPNQRPANAPTAARPDASAQRVKAGESVRPPTKVVDVNPVYPEDAQAARIQGAVMVAIVIGQSGVVIDAQVVRSIPALDEAAVAAVSQWEFEPTLLNGEPVEVEMTVVVNFTLQ